MGNEKKFATLSLITIVQNLVSYFLRAVYVHIKNIFFIY